MKHNFFRIIIGKDYKININKSEKSEQRRAVLDENSIDMTMT
jgi:hypothetical protein